MRSRLTEKQKEMMFEDFLAAEEAMGDAWIALDRVTDELGDASDALDEAKAELEYMRKLCREAGVFDNG